MSKKCNICGFTVNSSDPLEHGIGFPCGIGVSQTPVTEELDKILARFKQSVLIAQQQGITDPFFDATDEAKQSLRALREQHDNQLRTKILDVLNESFEVYIEPLVANMASDASERSNVYEAKEAITAVLGGKG